MSTAKIAQRARKMRQREEAPQGRPQRRRLPSHFHIGNDRFVVPCDKGWCKLNNELERRLVVAFRLLMAWQVYGALPFFLWLIRRFGVLSVVEYIEALLKNNRVRNPGAYLRWAANRWMIPVLETPQRYLRRGVRWLCRRWQLLSERMRRTFWFWWARSEEGEYDGVRWGPEVPPEDPWAVEAASQRAGDAWLRQRGLI